jgi:transcriptional regulator
MFVPGQYRPPDPAWARALVLDNPLALLTTNGAAEPWATHVPVVPAAGDLDDGSGPTGLVGARLLGHMNRANPHWAALRGGTHGTLVFSGPGAYVSPAWYGVQPAAPTWDFSVVHARVSIEPLAPGDETLKVVRETARRLEGRFGLGWTQDRSLEYFRRILPGVGAFAMSVLAADGMFKLSQEKDAATRDRICTGLIDRGRAADAETAAAIRRLPTRD